MTGVSSATTVMVADKHLRIVRVNDVRLNGGSLDGALPDSFRGLNLLDNIEGIDRDEVLSICNTILGGRRFPGGTKSFRRVIATSEMMGERWVVLLGPCLDAGGTADGIIYARFRSTVPDAIPHRDLDPERFYEYLVAGSSDLVFMADVEGRITFANQAIEFYAGMPAHSVLGKHFSEIVHPDDVDHCRAALLIAAEMNDPLPEFQCRVMALDGGVRSLVIKGSVIEARNGARVLGICRDVTESVELRERLLARNTALSALNSIVVGLASSDTLDRGLQFVLERTLGALGLKKGSISLVDSGGEPRVRVVAGYESGAIAAGTACPLGRLCSRTSEVTILDNVAGDPRLDEDDKSRLAALGIDASVQVPMSRGGAVNAILSLTVPPPAELSMEQMEIIRLAASILGPAIENVRLHSDLAARANQLAMLDRLAKSINAGRDLDSVIGVCLKEIAGVLEFDRALLVFVNDGGKAEVFGYAPGEEVASRNSIQVSDAQLEACVGLREPVVYRDLSKAMPHEGAPGSGSAVVVPLRRNNSTFGMLKLLHSNSGKFGERELVMMQAIAEHLAIAALNARLYEIERTKSLELEALAREAHHRIKNNLQMMAGLLRMSGDASSESGESAIPRCLRQIKAVATVHDLLTPKSKNTKLELADCLRRVAEQAIKGMGCGDRVSLRLGGDECWITPDSATALGIIVNELVCNAVEHAFVDGGHGTIRIDIESAANLTRIAVLDDGVGILPGFEIPLSPECGLGLVTSLATYGLGGTFSMEGTGEGTKAVIAFN